MRRVLASSIDGGRPTLTLSLTTNVAAPRPLPFLRLPHRHEPKGSNFGSPCNGYGGINPNHFTYLDHDAESSLDHTLFRQYSSTQGRWVSPDPAGLAAVDPTNPKSGIAMRTWGTIP